jgi:hypothetical protein
VHGFLLRFLAGETINLLGGREPELGWAGDTFHPFLSFNLEGFVVSMCSHRRGSGRPLPLGSVTPGATRLTTMYFPSLSPVHSFIFIKPLVRGRGEAGHEAGSRDSSGQSGSEQGMPCRTNQIS